MIVPDNFGGLGRVREIHALPSHHEDFSRRPINVVSLETEDKSIKIKREIDQYYIKNQSISQEKLINTYNTKVKTKKTQKNCIFCLQNH
jgi:hypothetical protein